MPGTCASSTAAGSDTLLGALSPTSFCATTVAVYATCAQSPGTMAPVAGAWTSKVTAVGAGHSAVSVPAMGVAVIVNDVTASAGSSGNQATLRPSPAPADSTTMGAAGTAVGTTGSIGARPDAAAWAEAPPTGTTVAVTRTAAATAKRTIGCLIALSPSAHATPRAVAGAPTVPARNWRPQKIDGTTPTRH